MKLLSQSLQFHEDPDFVVICPLEIAIDLAWIGHTL